MALLKKLFGMFRKEKKAGYYQIAALVKHQKAINEPLTKNDVKKLQNFSAFVGVPFTAHSETANLLNSLPQIVESLRERAVNARKWWQDVSKGSKIAAIIVGSLVFIFMIKTWGSPLVDFIKTCAVFIWALVESCLPVLYIAGPLVIIYYLAKRYAERRHEKLLAEASKREKMIPEAKEVAELLG